MVFSKYLFASIAGLAGGVNSWAFLSSGGAKVGQDLTIFDNSLSSEDSSNTDLIDKENARLRKEKKESEANFSTLNDQNENTKNKSRMRRHAGNDLSKKKHDVDLERRKNDQSLKEKHNQLQTKLNEGTASVKQQIQTKVEQLFQAVQSTVSQENQKLESALSTLKESNKKLIEKVKNCINELPNSIFVEEKKMNGKNYCDYVEEQKLKTSA